MRAGDLIRRLHEAQRQLPLRLLDVKAIIRRAHRLFMTSLATVIIGVTVASGATAVGINQAVRPDPIAIIGGWRVTKFEETENVRAVPVDFTGAVLRIVEVACEDEPCPVLIKSVTSNEDAEILEGMRLRPEEGGSIYVGRRPGVGDCVDIENPDLVLAEGVYDLVDTVQWQRAKDGAEDDLSFVYREELTLNVPAADTCPEKPFLEAAFRAQRIPAA